MNTPSLDQITDAVVSAFPKLTEQEQRVSLALYRLLAKGQPATADELSEASGVTRHAVGQILHRSHGVERRADGAITAFWGLTLSKTKHRFHLAGRELHTWCAWDTLFLPPLLGVAAEVESVCPVTGQRIGLAIDPAGVQSAEPTSVAVSFLLPTKSEIERSVTETFCCHVRFSPQARLQLNGFPEIPGHSSSRSKWRGRLACAATQHNSTPSKQARTAERIKRRARKLPRKTRSTFEHGSKAWGAEASPVWLLSVCCIKIQYTAP